MKSIAALVALASLTAPLHAAPESRSIQASFFCFQYAPGVQSIQVPDGAEGQAVRLSTANITDAVKVTLAPGEPLLLFHADDKSKPAAKVTIPGDLSKALIVLTPAPAGSAEPYRGFAIDYTRERFPLGTYRLVNVSKHPVRGAIGRAYAEVKPGGVAGIELQGEEGTTHGVKFEFNDKGKWNRLTESRAAVRRDRRWLVCVYQDPKTQRMNLRSIPDRDYPVTAPDATASITP
ncbi:hypothetical protein OKA04_09755 [Luteolibacter flavescens]|uniref:DUF4397 domain-containing protein n=1 Tax=Luteolibacter flavescens TaxID=1859460 RepID=A0ABT3FN60_9BACT|nr:hypothetical protein [Luteolibacter flavescens]MCW1885011.1 hypothetical protein [Luteolibacter flavescens]